MLREIILGTKKHSSIMALSSLYQSFPVFFLIINESCVWTAGSRHFVERIVLSGGTNGSSVLKVSDGTFKFILSGFHKIRKRITQK